MDGTGELMTTDGGLLLSYANMSSNSLESRYALCNSSIYANLPLCSIGNKSEVEFKPDYTQGFAMERIISIVVSLIFCWSFIDFLEQHDGRHLIGIPSMIVMLYKRHQRYSLLQRQTNSAFMLGRLHFLFRRVKKWKLLFSWQWLVVI